MTKKIKTGNVAKTASTYFDSNQEWRDYVKQTMNLHQRINAVRADCTAVAKNKQVGTGSYAYDVATHEDVNNMLKPLLIKYGLIDDVSLWKRKIVDTGKRQGKNQNPVIRYEGRYRYTVTNIDTPEQQISIFVEGHGEDAGDKAPGKATTYAFKTGRAKMFSITTGEDEEGRISDDQLVNADNVPLEPEHLDALLHLADELFGDDADEKVQAMCEKIFNVEKVSMIPHKFSEQAQNLLKNQAKRESKEAL